MRERKQERIKVGNRCFEDCWDRANTRGEKQEGEGETSMGKN
jgi:hypothetical protein